MQLHIPLPSTETLPLPGHSKIWHLGAFPSLDTYTQLIFSRRKKKKAQMGAAADWLQLWRGSRPNSFSDGTKTVGRGCGSEGGWESKRFTPGEKSSVSCSVEAWHAFIHDIRPSASRGTAPRAERRNDSCQKLLRLWVPPAEQTEDTTT